MAGGQFNSLLYRSTRSFSFFYKPIKRYSHESKGSYSRLMEERAPSVAEEFERVAAEKAREAEQGKGSQTAGKDISGDAEVDESAKNNYKQHEAAADYQRRGVNN